MLTHHLLQLLVAVAGADLPVPHQEAGAQGELVEQRAQQLVGAALLLVVLEGEVGCQQLVDGLDERLRAEGRSTRIPPPPSHVHQGLVQVPLTRASGGRLVEAEVHLGPAEEEEGGHDKATAPKVHHGAQATEDGGRLQCDGRVPSASPAGCLLQHLGHKGIFRCRIGTFPPGGRGAGGEEKYPLYCRLSWTVVFRYDITH